MPAPVTEYQPPDSETDLSQSGELKIAWRYQDQAQESSEPGATLFGHTYDLTKHFDKLMLDKIQLNSWIPPSGMYFTFESALISIFILICGIDLF